MKIICLLLLCGIAYLHAAPTVSTTPDYRELFDRTMITLVNERIAAGERFIQNLSHQMREFEATKNEQIRQQIVQELEFVLPMTKGVDQFITNELKKPNLDISERYEAEKLRAIAEIVVKMLTEVQSKVAKKSTFFAATSAPIDYRKEYDRLLMQEIEGRIQRADGGLLHLQRELNQYVKTKDVATKERIVKEIDLFLPELKAGGEHIKTELKRTDLNTLERFLYEKANDEIELLIKHYTQIETQVKSGKPVAVFFAATSAPTDWRSEYDRLLFEFVNENTRRADYFLASLQRQFLEYQTSKNKDLKQRITEEIEFTLPMLKRGIEYCETQLKKTDLDHIERFLFEKARDETQILTKHFDALAAAVAKA